MSSGGQTKLSCAAAEGDLKATFAVMTRYSTSSVFSIDQTRPSATANSHSGDRLNASASYPLDSPDVRTDRLRGPRFPCLRVPGSLFGLAEASDARFALLLELADDLGISLVPGREEERLREINPRRTGFIPQARKNLRDVDRDHGAGASQVRQDLLVRAVCHKEFA